MEESTESLTSRYADAILPFTVCLGIFMVIGILGNILVLRVFVPVPRNRRNNFRIFVISLAIVDLFVCSILFPTDMIRQRNEFNFHNEALCAVKNYINNYGAVASALSLMVINIDRTRKVVHPLRRQMSKSLAFKLCVGFTFVFSLVINVPAALTSGITETNRTNIYGNQTVVFMCNVKDSYQGHPLLSAYEIFHVLLFATVSIAAIVMYICILRVLFKRQNLMHTFQSKKRSALSVEGKAKQYFKYTVDTTSSARCEESKMEHDGERIINTLSVISLSLENSNEHKQPTIENGSGHINKLSGISVGIKENIEDNQSSKSKDSVAMTSSLKEIHANCKNKSSYSNMKKLHSRRFPIRTMIWFTLTVIFIGTNVVSLIFSKHMEGETDFGPAKYALFMSFRKLYYVNSIINPIVYLILDQTFRQSSLSLLRKHFTCCCD